METHNGNYCVYMHINKINNKVYVGQTCQDVNRRWRHDGSGYLIQQNGKYTQPLFARAILKYGWDSFEHIIWAESLTKEEANRCERLLIAMWDTRNPKHGYNIKFGGDNCTLTEESKKKISAAKKGTTLSEETRRKISQKLKGRVPPNKGKRLSEEARRKISEAGIGRHPSEETRLKMSKNNGMKKDEVRRKFSENMKGKNNHESKPVLCVETGIVYETSIEAGNALCICHSSIRKCCSGKQKTAGGYTWKFV